ncbi:hypothetical protein EON81_21070 [bacterium]|nr:MAG: hypothetical protein EON81_21070 [bacterium]
MTIVKDSQPLTEVAPFGLDAEPELWIIVSPDGDPFECNCHLDNTDWVIAGRSERAVLVAHGSMPNHPTAFRPSPGRAAMTTEPSLRAAILSVIGRRVEGWIIFDERGIEVRREHVIEERGAKL